MSVKTVEEVSAQVPPEDFQALEEKVYRTIELYKAAKEARATAERDVKRLREQLEEREEENETMRRELVQMRKDRDHGDRSVFRADLQRRRSVQHEFDFGPGRSAGQWEFAVR